VPAFGSGSGDEQPAEADGLRVFAGPRLDPFFIDLAGVLATEAREQLAFRAALRTPSSQSSNSRPQFNSRWADRGQW
jgi:hypothetical protein